MDSKIISIEKISEYYHVVKMTKPEAYVWQPGQFARFTLNGIDLNGDKNFRIFSIASIESENIITIATKALPNKTSNFKKALFALKPSDIVDISKAMGNFTIRDNTSPMIMYASGIGVTPIRGLVKNLNNKADVDIRIIYASYDNYIFEDELQEFDNANPNVKFIKTVEVDETMNTLKDFAIEYGNEAYYYISGSPFVVGAVKTAYKELDINEDRMIDDSFIGY